jgi:Rad52/22 family double-strand break repair protein
MDLMTAKYVATVRVTRCPVGFFIHAGRTNVEIALGKPAAYRWWQTVVIAAHPEVSLRSDQALDLPAFEVCARYAISEANRIFGFDGWSRETVESRCVLARENRGAFLAVYTARVRISVQAGGSTIIREGHGSGEGR